MLQKKRITLSSIAVIAIMALVLSYQNCSDVRVAPNEPPLQIASKTSRLDGEFCSGIPGQDIQQLQNFTLVNLTAKPVGKRLLADSDIDGVPDETELANSALGFVRTNSLSSGILDGICYYSQGSNGCVPATCDRTPLNFGLLKCDATAYSSSTSLTGIDTDSDESPDFIEILRGTDPLRATLDEDNDMLSNGAKSNLDEIQRGLDPLSSMDLDPSLQMNVRFAKLTKSTSLTNPDPCLNQDHYSFSATSFPLLDLEASTNTNFPVLSHDRNVNVLMAFYTSHPLDSTKKARIFYSIVKINKDDGPPNINLKISDFTLLGTFDP